MSDDRGFDDVRSEHADAAAERPEIPVDIGDLPLHDPDHLPDVKQADWRNLTDCSLDPIDGESES